MGRASKYQSGDTIKSMTKNKVGYVIGSHGNCPVKIDFIPLCQLELDGSFEDEIIRCKTLLIERPLIWTFPKKPIKY
jgi:hypothetical protein